MRWQGEELFKSTVYTQFIAARSRILKNSTTAASVQIDTIRDAYKALFSRLARTIWQMS